jgi:hypothetical protein
VVEEHGCLLALWPLKLFDLGIAPEGISVTAAMPPGPVGNDVLDFGAVGVHNSANCENDVVAFHKY